MLSWNVRVKGGDPFDLTGQDLSLYRLGFNGRERIETFEVYGNVVKWSWPGAEQNSPGTYSFLLVMNENKEGMRTLEACDALRLVASSCGTCIGMPDHMDLEGILDDYLQAVDKANEAADKAIRAANEASKVISSMGSALDSIKKLLSSGSVYIGVLSSGGEIPKEDSNAFMLCGPGKYSVGGSTAEVGIGQLGILSNASGQWKMETVQVVEVLQSMDDETALTSPNPASAKAIITFLDTYLKTTLAPGTLASVIPGWKDFFSKIDDIGNITGPLDFSGTNYLTKEENLKDACMQLDEEVKAANDNIAILGAEAANLAKTKQDKLSAGTGIAIQGNTISCTLDTNVFEVVQSLPERPETGKENKIYVVPNPDGQGDNMYDEYAWINGAWEKVGEFKAEVDLSAYQTKQDDSLQTEAKTVVGAINELQEKQRVLPSTSGKADEFLEGSSDGAPVWTSVFSVTSKMLTRSNMGLLNAGDDLDNIVTPGVYRTNTPSSNIANVPFPGKPFVMYVVETGFVGEFVQIVVTPYSESNIYVRSCYNKANWQPWQQIVTSTNTDLAMRPIYEACGAVWNAETGYYELNGLTDITKKEMMTIYVNTFGWWNMYGPVLRYAKDIRTNLRPRTYSIAFDSSTVYPISECLKLEVLNLIPYWTKNLSYPLYIQTTCPGVLYNNSKLKKIIGVIKIVKVAEVSNVFNIGNRCTSIMEVNVQISNGDISFFKDSPLLSYESMQYLVDNASNTQAVIVTINPTTYSYLSGTAQPTEEVGGTTEEWQALMTAAASKQISFAIEE